MLPLVRKSLIENKISPDQTVVVGVSGGADSLCLLHYLVKGGFRAVAAHLDHGLRPDSGSDADFVRDFSKGLGFPAVIKSADVEDYADQNKLSIEEAARDVRYRFLFETAAEKDARAVLVAHHADDQVETVLMHMLRGTGLAGMRGMEASSLTPDWSADIPLVRPLLGVWREQILQYNAGHGIIPRIDESNQDTTYYRNRLRHELLPYLEGYNPNIRQVIWRLADTAAVEYQVLESRVDEAWDLIAVDGGEGYVGLLREVLRKQPLGGQRGLLRRAVSVLRPGLRDIDHAAVERARSFVEAPSNSGQADLIAGLKLENDGELLYIKEWGVMHQGGGLPHVLEPLVLPLPGSLELSPHWVISAEMVETGEEQRKQVVDNVDPHTAWLDAGPVAGPLVVRPWLAGDRFSPLGMPGKTVKVGDFFINQKVPQQVSGQWPLLVCGDKIVWVVGMQIAHDWRVTADTQKMVKLRLLER